MKNNTVKISHPIELVGFLRSIGTESRFVSLRTETVVKNLRGGKKNPFSGTVKVCRRNGLVNVNFEKSCERNLTELGQDPSTYQRGEVWYRHEMTEDNKPLPLCVHKTKTEQFYLQYFPYRNLETSYFLNGRRLTDTEVEQMKSSMYDDNGEEWKPKVITLSVDSIREIKFRKIQMLNHTVSRIQDRINRWKTSVTLNSHPIVTPNYPITVSV